MTYIDERLKELYRQKSQKTRLEAMKAELMQQEDAVAKKAVELEAIKKKEQLDVDKLEGKSIKAIFATIAGNKEEKLSKERQEAYAAAMKYEAAKRDLEGIESDLHYCQEELDKLADCEAEYRNLLEQKKNSLKTAGTQKANEIMRMEKDLFTLEHEITELDEALDAGYKAFELVDKIVVELEEAADLANWDTFMDSMFVDMQKHEHIHTAQDLIGDLRTELRRFKTELADVHIQENIIIEMDDFSEFADWFLDNIFTDWSIKEKIDNSLREAYETKGQITNTINLLKDMRDARQVSRFELQDKLESIVVEG